MRINQETVRETQKTMERCKSAQVLSARGVVSRLRQESGEVFRIKNIIDSRNNKLEKKEITVVEKEEEVNEQKRS